MGIAGFGLIFVGIDFLQEGLSALEGHVTPEQFPPDTFTGRLGLVLIGLIITIVTQSSSAGVATALAAVHTNTISLNQAAAMVIGMDIGTTATAVLATIGGNVHARRTGFAHVIYNSLTGLMAFCLLTPYMSLISYILPEARQNEPELVLVGFHTFFNVLGVIAILPFTDRFANLMVRLVPARGNPLTRQLDRSLMTAPSIAIAGARNTLWVTATSLLSVLGNVLRDTKTNEDMSMLNDVTSAIEEINDYLQQLSNRSLSENQINDYVACLHVLDHLRRIEIRVREEKRLQRCRDDESLVEMSDQVVTAIGILSDGSHPIPAEQTEQIQTINRNLKTDMRNYRRRILENTSSGTLNTSKALLQMDTARSLRRIGYHIWRITFHLTDSSVESLAERAVPIDK